ncbi:hypothetical protein NDR87_24710 [Nocardia sp. CDC159]|uniref:Butirosin biosynthesis protein H-like n=1 Tax=Nocardia pulmonis TaxID=2951408 RepID=A0A9X2IYK2_9NOCA|nr:MULTISPECIES: hypothetical protein [Nocardia]MCM6775105.1 hypothetical protein [Nocardia pulmonis]MCM6789575.1 hypothetical protein [Nocardia sp. CDC159]
MGDVMLYTGSGPYCYSNSLAMMLGDDAPTPAVIEVLTGAPFGMALVGGRTPFFDPYGWNPELGLDIAVALLGWRCESSSGGAAGEAEGRLREALAAGPVLVGPVEMGLLRHQPDMCGAIGADHFVVVLAVEGDRVLMHDPQGYPFVTLPVAEFMAAWRGGMLDYGQPYTMRFGFVRERHVRIRDALRGSVPNAVAFLRNRKDLPVPEGTRGAFDAAIGLADLLTADPGPDLRNHLMYFAIRVGARRLSDAARVLGEVGLEDAAAVARTQARLVGSLQYDIVTGDVTAAAETLHRLAPTYDRLACALDPSLG